MLLKRKSSFLQFGKKQKFSVIFQNICKYFHSNEKNNDICQGVYWKGNGHQTYDFKKPTFFYRFSRFRVNLRNSIIRFDPVWSLVVLGRLNIKNPLAYVPEKGRAF